MNERSLFYPPKAIVLTLGITALIVLVASCSLPPSNTTTSVGVATPLLYEDHVSSREYTSALDQLQSQLAIEKEPDPFILEGEIFEFDWCRPSGRRNKSLKDLGTRLEDDSC